jgi:hypothetical protein
LVHAEKVVNSVAKNGMMGYGIVVWRTGGK